MTPTSTAVASFALVGLVTCVSFVVAVGLGALYRAARLLHERRKFSRSLARAIEGGR